MANGMCRNRQLISLFLLFKMTFEIDGGVSVISQNIKASIINLKINNNNNNNRISFKSSYYYFFANFSSGSVHGCAEF